MSQKNIVTKKISFDCPVELIERLDKLASYADLPRQKLIVNFLELSVDFVEQTKKVGILHLTLLLRDFQYNAREWAAKIRKAEITGIDIKDNQKD
ncbi:MAG: hypothetical protein OEV64_14120 [Desulfobulbaceae bacterium]|nr:hypothetical protein [Desulfobulbaceae bacterium]